jgi:ArsR family transcriptional regulator
MKMTPMVPPLALAPLGRDAEAMARILRILANPDRLRMLCRMGMAEMAGIEEPTVTELVRLTGLSQSRVSQHLALLREAGVVAPRRLGQAVRYRLLDPEVRRVMEALCHLCEAEALAPGQDPGVA